MIRKTAQLSPHCTAFCPKHLLFEEGSSSPFSFPSSLSSWMIKRSWSTKSWNEQIWTSHIQLHSIRFRKSCRSWMSGFIWGVLSWKRVQIIDLQIKILKTWRLIMSTCSLVHSMYLNSGPLIHHFWKVWISSNPWTHFWFHQQHHLSLWYFWKPHALFGYKNWSIRWKRGW